MKINFDFKQIRKYLYIKGGPYFAKPTQTPNT